MAAFVSMYVEDRDNSAGGIAAILRTRSSDPRQSVRRVADWLRSFAGGNRRANYRLRTGSVKAVYTLTFASTGPANGQTIGIAGTTFTAATTPSGANDFQRSDTPATVAAALATKLNTVDAVNRPKVNASIVATVDGAVVTLTARDPGLLGQGIEVRAIGTFANTTIANPTAGSDGTQTDLVL